ncbi:uncharacterized protein LY89DRAFT_665814 [Mollisia scopiformis]|uniref:CCHC-type domain-containing protein n=1 Tax=Mollisia scopiformis TaxID=149040 RepID=A0A194XNS2_MOLSC|nr:uncharacterized protein LY89DRAFT_665814 [Mollisia scopiformis]KUJ21382.1 hypothetical protein LY89DRAFT_665814 [Mollisia scopiformis]
MQTPTTQEQLRHALEFGSPSPDSTLDLGNDTSLPLRTMKNTDLSFKPSTAMDLEPDSPMSRFLAAPTPLSPNTPTKPKAMRAQENAGPLSFSVRQAERVGRLQSPSVTPKRKELLVKDSIQDPRGGKRPKVEGAGWERDHWSPPSSRSGTPATRELFPDHRKEKRRGFKNDSRSRFVTTEKEQGVGDLVGNEYPTVLSGRSPDIPDGPDTLCYNCGKKGHWFIDCMVGCGRCGEDGHKTYHCDFSGKEKKVKLEEIKEDGVKKAF